MPIGFSDPSGETEGCFYWCKLYSPLGKENGKFVYYDFPSIKLGVISKEEAIEKCVAEQESFSEEDFAPAAKAGGKTLEATLEKTDC